MVSSPARQRVYFSFGAALALLEDWKAGRLEFSILPSLPISLRETFQFIGIESKFAPKLKCSPARQRVVGVDFDHVEGLSHISQQAIAEVSELSAGLLVKLFYDPNSL